jgi:thiol-disulfide isomerase/thioredoxin
MKKTALLLVFSLLSFFPVFADVVFIQGDLKMAKARAAREGKLILLDFWANYCTPCRMMEEYTFTNPEVEDYINAHYIPVKVDIQSFDGFDLKNQFNVSLLPTIIVLNSKGVQVGRHEETFSASRLIPVLETYNEAKNRQKVSIPKRDLAYNASTGYSNSRTTTSNNRIPSTAAAAPTTTRIASAHVTRTPTSSLSKPVVRPATPSPIKPSNRPTTTVSIPNKIVRNEPEKSLVAAPSRLGVEGAVPTTVQPNTYSVQVSAYFAEDKLRDAMPIIKDEYASKGRIFVSKRAENGKTIFRILVGNFASRILAEKFMKANRIAGIVKDLDALK